jgi:hypothetical protein
MLAFSDHRESFRPVASRMPPPGGRVWPDSDTYSAGLVSATAR